MTQLYPRASTIRHYFCLVIFLFAGMNRVFSDVHSCVNLAFALESKNGFIIP
jgi:hypothetical protein